MVIVQYGVLVGLLAEANDSASIVDIVTLPPHFYALPKVLEPLRLSVHGATTCGGPTHAPTNRMLLTGCILVIPTNLYKALMRRVNRQVLSLTSSCRDLCMCSTLQSLQAQPNT